MNIRRFLLLIFLISAHIACSAAIMEYVKPHALYLGGPNAQGGQQVFEEFAPALASMLKETCRGRQNCVLTALDEEKPIYSGSAQINYHFSFDPDGIGTFYVYILYECPSTFSAWWDVAGKKEVCSREEPPIKQCDACRAKGPVPKVGNPIFPFNDIKQQVEVDYRNATGTLSFVRNYQSDTGLWSHNYDIVVLDYNYSNLNAGPRKEAYCDLATLPVRCYEYFGYFQPYDITLRRGNARRIRFGTSTDYSPRPAIDDRVETLTDAAGAFAGIYLTNSANGSIEIFGVDGNLLSTEVNGAKTVFHYSDLATKPDVAPTPGLLIAVVDPFGSELNFRYNSARQIATMIAPDGGIYHYAYDNVGNLTSVTYPDLKVKQYVYNEPGMLVNMQLGNSRFLTGIIDENGVRFATFKYEGGRAVSTEHAGGVERFVTSQLGGSASSVTGPLGDVQTYAFSVDPISNMYRNHSQTRQSGTGSRTISADYEYDAQGNVVTTTDFSGAVTKFTFDLSRNLEVTRGEAFGTTLERTVTTAWHPTRRLPTKIASAKRLVTNIYDNAGRLLTRSEQATSDLNGSLGLKATPVGPARTWTYIYGVADQILSVTGPRADINNTTRYTYDDHGNLTAVTNQLGESPRLS